MVFMPLVVVWIGQFYRYVIGPQNVKVAVIGRLLFCNRRPPFSYHTVRFLVNKIDIKRILNMASVDSEINKPQCGRPKRAELPDAKKKT